ncbi:MAG: GTP cyclohydrolase I FolE [Holosporaceae bacterium]|jgi:GTP cyclohydrolase I|nr:GTP cyclohydrolase I FolE [Holosporaceae bacterium]
MAGNGTKVDMEDHIKSILKQIDPDCGRLEETPRRAAKACKEFFSGYDVNAVAVVSRFYDSGMDDLVILRNIGFQSYCEHHLAPIVGSVGIGYVPDGRIIGASKLVRLVDCFACRLQLQERMTMEIAKTLEEVLRPRGVCVYVEAEHFCMSHRGVKKPGARLVTRYFCGILKERFDLRREFLDAVAGN